MIDWDSLRTDLLAIRDDNATSVILRRGETTLAAQTARVERAGTSARQRASEGGGRAAGAITILGDVGLDIQVKDRFTLNGVLYEVTFVRPNRRSATIAEAEAIE